MFVERDEESRDTGEGEVDCVLATLADDLAAELAPLFRARVARSSLPLHATSRGSPSPRSSRSR